MRRLSARSLKITNMLICLI